MYLSSFVFACLYCLYFMTIVLLSPSLSLFRVLSLFFGALFFHSFFFCSESDMALEGVAPSKRIEKVLVSHLERTALFVCSLVYSFVFLFVVVHK